MINPFHFQQNKYASRKLLQERLAFYCQRFGFKYRKLAIRKQRGRWGSCNSKGDLSFNYLLATLPTELVDYIVVHELCHTKVMNHSGKFWDSVRSILPNYKSLKRDLNRYTLRQVMLK